MKLPGLTSGHTRPPSPTITKFTGVSPLGFCITEAEAAKQVGRHKLGRNGSTVLLEHLPLILETNLCLY